MGEAKMTPKAMEMLWGWLRVGGGRSWKIYPNKQHDEYYVELCDETTRKVYRCSASLHDTIINPEDGTTYFDHLVYSLIEKFDEEQVAIRKATGASEVEGG